MFIPVFIYLSNPVVGQQAYTRHLQDDGQGAHADCQPKTYLLREIGHFGFVL